MAWCWVEISDRSVPGAERWQRHGGRTVTLWVPGISSTSCDQAIFVDHATDLRVPSDTVLLKVDGFG